MKKQICFLLLIVPLLTMAQDRNERGFLEGGGKITVNDIGHVHNYDSIAKVGTFAENRVSGQVFFGLSNSQVGIFGSYLSGDLLSEKYRALSFEEFSGGPIFRQSIGSSEFKLGFGYYSRKQRDYGYEGMQRFDVLGRHHGMKALFGVAISQCEFNFLPKLTLSAEQNFEFGSGNGIADWFKGEEVFSMKQYFSASAYLSIYALHFMPEFHISPLVGAEVGQMTRGEPMFMVGVIISSNLIRADVLKVGYLFGRGSHTVEGFFVTVNVTGPFTPFF